MLIGVAITGFYSIRMLTLVFFDPPAAEKQPHPAGLAMRTSLAILAVGSLLSWLLAGPFSKMLADSLPYHDLEAETTLDIVVEVVSQPATWITLAIVAAGIGLWYVRGRLMGVSRVLSPIGRLTRNDYGFEWLNRQIILVANQAASALRRTQTGQLNWNVLGIAGALLLLIILIAWIG
jgi:NADH:ubiquinone oxidoreductase subunit 5 (subunit L)/multisubunit Na+/H+ antiporter MnhA subunit